MTTLCEPHADRNGDAAVLESVARSRFTCRAYQSELVPRAVIETILRNAQNAPSWCNTQPWQLIITEGEATSRFARALYDHASDEHVRPSPDIPFPEAYVGIYDQRRKEVGKQLYGAVGIDKGDRQASRRMMLENFRLFGAPHVAIMTTDRKLGTYGAVDCGVYVGYFVLAAQSLGVATTPQAALAVHGDFVRNYFSIPSDRLLLCGISFGWPDMEHASNNFRARRAEIASVAHFLGE